MSELSFPWRIGGFSTAGREVRVTAFANPIEWQETRHQQRHLPAFLQRYWWLVALMLACAVIVVALTLREVTAPTRDLALYMIWMVHGLAAARAMAVGANAISREHVGLTWDTLVMTGVSARTILLGKWLGVMRHAAPWMLMLASVRLAMLPIFMLSFVNRYAWRYTYNRYGGYSGGYYSMSPYLDWVPWAALLAVVMTVALTVLELMACTALGLAASAVLRRGWLAMVAAFVVRFTPVVVFAAFTYYEVGDGPSWRVLRFPALSLADGGTAPLYQLALPYSSWTSTAHMNALSGLMLSAGLLLLLLVGAVLATWYCIRAAGALPHPKMAVESA